MVYFNHTIYYITQISMILLMYLDKEYFSN